MKRIIAALLILTIALVVGCAAKPTQKVGAPAPQDAATQVGTQVTSDVSSVDTALADIDSLDDSLDPELDSLDESLDLNI